MEKVYGIIYKATNTVNGKVYIGQTVRTLDFRKTQHLNNAKIKKTVFYSAINKYGADAFTWEIIDTAQSKQELNEKEIQYIKDYNSCIYFENPKGYNVRLGGDGLIAGSTFTEDHKKKLAEAWTEERKQEKAEQMKQWYEENGSKMRKPIYAINIHTDEIIYFEPICEASNYFDVPQPNISRILSGDRKTIRGGWTFEYVDERTMSETDFYVDLYQNDNIDAYNQYMNF